MFSPKNIAILTVVFILGGMFGGGIATYVKSLPAKVGV